MSSSGFFESNAAFSRASMFSNGLAFSSVLARSSLERATNLSTTALGVIIPRFAASCCKSLSIFSSTSTFTSINVVLQLYAKANSIVATSFSLFFSFSFSCVSISFTKMSALFTVSFTIFSSLSTCASIFAFSASSFGLFNTVSTAVLSLPVSSPLILCSSPYISCNSLFTLFMCATIFSNREMALSVAPPAA